MNQPEIIDTAALRRPILIFFLVAVISGTLWWTSDHYTGENITSLEQARTNLGLAQEQYDQTIEAGDILNSSEQRYQQLQQRKFVGDEPRLLWIESLRATGRKHHLYNLQYNLRQQQAVQMNGLENNEHYQLYASTMQLQLDLAHEVDLLRFFTDLNERRPAIYQLRGCSLKPLPGNNGISLDKANVKATCDLLWYTLKNQSLSETDEDYL